MWDAGCRRGSGARSRVAGAALLLSPRPCTDQPGRSDYLHDGFFASVRAGVALLDSHVETEPPVAPFRTRTRGIGQSAEIAVGGTPETGLVLGGSIWTARIDPTFVEGGRVVAPDDDSVKVTTARFGPFLDWYPDPRRGFHTSLTMAFAFQIESDTKGNPVRPPSLGAALAVGTGYEWFVGRDFSFGFIARVALSDTARRTAGSDERTLSLAPDLAISYTYH